MGCRGSTANCSLSFEAVGRQALIAMEMGELRRTSYRVLYLFRARELTFDNIDEPLIGYLEGQLARCS